jgi:glutamate/tyrosine decarboxylase-like PLP-dependent enzyme
VAEIVPEHPALAPESPDLDELPGETEEWGALEAFPELVRAYLAENRRPETPVVEHHGPDELGELFDVSLPEDGAGEGELLPLIERYLRLAVRTGHPLFFNQLFGGFSPVSFLGELASSLTNTTLCTYEAAPVATLMERELVGHMGRFVGYEKADGIFCTGGSNANLLALLCARHRAFPDVKHHGLASGARPTLFVSDQAHYSWDKAANILGLGVDRMIRVASDARGRMDPVRLEREIARSRERGETPLLVGATAGTTVLGAFDPLREVAEVARANGLWLHVDGAWGGSVLLSERHRHLLEGSAASDSFSWDPHKMLGATLTCSVFLTRETGVLEQACGTTGETSEYILHDVEEGAFDRGRASLQCGRRADAVKLWLMWRQQGDRGFARRIEHLFALAGHAQRRITRESALELVAPVQSLNVCFRHVAPGREDLDAFNLDLRESLRRSGAAFVNHSEVRGVRAIRLVFANAAVTPDDVDRLFDRLLEHAALQAPGAEPIDLIP